jgi:hypothetical protein
MVTALALPRYAPYFDALGFSLRLCREKSENYKKSE